MSAGRAVIGALIVFLFFPILALDLDAQHGINSFNVYVGPYCIILSMGAALVTSVGVSSMINGYLIIRDIIHAPIAGAIMGGSASFFAVNPVQPILTGFVAGLIQTLIQNLFEK